MKVITILNQKGGTGKSTTAGALLQAGVKDGKRMLGIDLDGQGNLSYFLHADTTLTGSYELLTGKETIKDVIQTTPQGMDVICASWELSTIKSDKGSARRLQTALTPIKRNYDYIVIDVPPSIDELQYNALQATDGVIIPLKTDVTCMQALQSITDTIKQFKQSNKGLSKIGFIFSQYDNRSILARQMADAIKAVAEVQGFMFLGCIRNGIAVQEAQATQQSLFDYAPKCKPATDYKNLFDAIKEI